MKEALRGSHWALWGLGVPALEHHYRVSLVLVEVLSPLHNRDTCSCLGALEGNPDRKSVV